jgi:hypothetical protein
MPANFLLLESHARVADVDLVYGTSHLRRSKERPWFVMMLAKGARMLRIRHWSEASEKLVRYFYLDRIYAKSFQTIWEEVGLLIDIVSFL